MQRLVASSDLWPDVTASGADGLERTYPVGLELTYGFDPAKREMGVVISGHRALDAKDPDRLTTKSVLHIVRDGNLCFVFVSNLTTAQRLVAEMGLPPSAAVEVREHLDEMARSLEPFVQDCFLGRVCDVDDTPRPAPNDTQPIEPITMSQLREPTLIPEPITETVEPAPPIAQAPHPDAQDNILVLVRRDVSAAFRRERGACTLKYTLFSEPHLFRAIIEARCTDKATGAVQAKNAEFSRKRVEAIVEDLKSDNTAYQIAMFFGDTDSRRIAQMSTVLQLGFADRTELDMHTFKQAPAPDPKPSASGPQFVEVFNNGQYIRVPA